MSKHIGHIEITNFKSIRHQKIDGCKRINVFIGYPNVGKSAILEAISSFSYLQKGFIEPFDKLCRLRNVSELFFEANINEKVSIRFSNDLNIEFDYLSETTLNYVILQNGIRSKTPADPFGTKFRANKQIQFSTDTDKAFLVFDRMANEVILIVKKYEFRNSFNEKKTNGLSLYSPYGENLVDVVQFNKELRKEVGELFKFYDLKLLIDQATNSIRGLKQMDEETVFSIPFYQMADTLQRLIFHKAAIMSNKSSVLLFEEPEAHMFPPYISKFTGEIIYEKDNGNQYFISTHSPFVVNDFIEDARDELSVYLVGYKNGETVIKRLSDEELHEIYQYGVDLFFNLSSYLE